METWEKVTTRSRVSIYRTNDPMETIAAICLKLDQDDRHTHICKKKTKKHCQVTVLVDSQVSDHCPWATGLQIVRDLKIQVQSTYIINVSSKINLGFSHVCFCSKLQKASFLMIRSNSSVLK